MSWFGLSRLFQRPSAGSPERLTPQQLKQRLDRGDRLEIIDLRHWSQVLTSGEKLPGARWVERAKIESVVAPNGEYVLYCS